MKYALSNVVGDPFWLTTIPMALVGWAVALVGSIINSSVASSTFPVFSWWGIAFEMITILLVLHVAFSNQLRMYRLTTLAFLSIATIYVTNNTNNFVWRDNSSSGAAAAGNIVMAIINFVWIMYFGTTQDEPLHTYIDSFAVYKRTSPPQSDFHRRMREKRRKMMAGSPPSDARSTRTTGPNRNSALGTASQPYRMSDVPRNINIGEPTGFSRQTDPTNPYGSGTTTRPTTQTGSNPLSSTYLYSVDQLHRHGLDSHEVENENASAQRYSMGSTMPGEMNYTYGNEDEDGFETSYPVAKARAKFSYEARISDGEIPFQEGEILDVCDMTGNWWYCRRANGEVGICPCNYLEVLDEPLL